MVSRADAQYAPLYQKIVKNLNSEKKNNENSEKTSPPYFHHFRLFETGDVFGQSGEALRGEWAFCRRGVGVAVHSRLLRALRNRHISFGSAHAFDRRGWNRSYSHLSPSGEPQKGQTEGERERVQA